MPRSCSRTSTLPGDSGNFTYIITAGGSPGDESKWGNGLAGGVMPAV